MELFYFQYCTNLNIGTLHNHIEVKFYDKNQEDDKTFNFITFLALKGVF